MTTDPFDDDLAVLEPRPAGRLVGCLLMVLAVTALWVAAAVAVTGRLL